MEGNEIFAKRIKELITGSEKTQKVIAQEMRISETALSNYKSGDREPGAYALKKIADYFGVSLDYLAGKQNCKTIKREAIHKMLGLSDNAISALREARKKSPLSLDPTIAGINTLLESQNGHEIARLVWAYTHADFSKAFGLDIDGNHVDRLVESVLFYGPKNVLFDEASIMSEVSITPSVSFRVSSVANTIILEIHEYLRQMREAVEKEAHNEQASEQ